MQTVKTAAGTSGENAKTEPVNLLRRVGSTTYMVTVHFSTTSKETMTDKMLRLVEREVRNSA